jgi:hypothetical protein
MFLWFPYNLDISVHNYLHTDYDVCAWKLLEVVDFYFREVVSFSLSYFL